MRLMRRNTPIIGLCGGIGAGKTTVAEEFARQGCCVVHSDRLNHEVLRRADVQATLRNWWGADVVTDDGAPDRRRIAEIVFADPAEKRRLEDLVYPLIGEMREAKIRAVEQDPAVKAVILDSPLLFESNLDRRCDSIVFVDASRATRLRRVQQTRGWDEAQLDQRERWQMPTESKRKRADFAVNNDGPPDRLGPQVSDILRAVTSRCAAE